MSFRDILVHVDNSKNAAARVETAVALATAQQAHLTGLYIRTQPQVPEFVRVQLGREVQELQQRHAAQAEAEAEALFDSRSRGIDTEWRSAAGDVVQLAGLSARYSDLTIVGQTDPDADEVTPLADHLVLEAGRPVLVVPFAGRFPQPGKRVMVAWNASREATRAVNDALPLLRQADSVRVIAINPNGGPAGHGDIPGADIGLHLARHGVKAEAEHIRADDIEVGDLLLSRLADEDIDLLVMGAYGRSRLRELVLGGATRQILRHMTVPVLMSH